MKTHMIIGDSHSKPGVKNDRFEWAGNFALHHRPDVIIDMGDWADMGSLSSYDKGKKSFEGRRYNKDIAAAVDARRRFYEPIKRYNSRRASNKKKQYSPRLVGVTGNHEFRIVRVADFSPELEGAISLSDLQREAFGWEVVPFLQPIEIDGIFYSHYFPSGNTGTAISGVYAAGNLVRQGFKSCTCAHSHLRDFKEQVGLDGKRHLGLVAGCYFEHQEAWAGHKSNQGWWRGLILKHDVKDGYYDPEYFSMNRIKKEYS